MNVQVSVRTADGVPIVGASLALAEGSGGSSGSGATTDANGTATVSPSGSSFSVTATMTNYRDQSTSFSVDSSGNTVWDDPGTIVTGSGDQLSVEIRLGRLVPSPTAAYQESIFANPDKDPSKVVPLQHTFTYDNGTYSFLFGGNRNFWAATGPVLLQSPATKGWGSFAADHAASEPQTTGHFAWLEWAPPGGTPSSLNRYLIGLWRTRSPVASGSRPRDAIVFYSPNTTPDVRYLSDSPPYRGNYPYALNQADDPAKLAQRYVTLGLRYLFDEKFFTYQLLAAKRDCLVVFFIQPSGNWEVMRRPDGVQRLLAEAILFEHRARAGSDDPSGTLDTAPAAGFARTKAARHLPPPALGTVVTAGFSAGICPIVDLIHAVPAKGQYPARTWKDESADSYLANPTDFVQNWCEIWDLDGYYPCIGDPGTWAVALATWQSANGHAATGDRVARCYHSDFTGWSASSPDAMGPMLGKLVSGNAPAPAAGGKAVEREGVSGTAVFLDSSYLTGNGPPDGWDESATPATPQTPEHIPDTPAFWKAVAHQAIPMICFAHAAGLSLLRKM